jgi:serine protease Do
VGLTLLAIAIISGAAVIIVRGGFPWSQPGSPLKPGEEGDGSPVAVGDFMVVSDDYGVLEIEIPTSWNDIDGTPWYFEGDLVGASIWASPDLDSFTGTWNVPGVVFDVSDMITEQVSHLELLDIRRGDMLDYCELDRRYAYEDERYQGKYDLFEACGGSDGPWYMILSAVSQIEQDGYLILVEAQIVNEEDWDIIQHVLDTYKVVGELP